MTPISVDLIQLGIYAAVSILGYFSHKVINPAPGPVTPPVPGPVTPPAPGPLPDLGGLVDLFEKVLLELATKLANKVK